MAVPGGREWRGRLKSLKEASFSVQPNLQHTTKGKMSYVMLSVVSILVQCTKSDSVSK